MKKVLILFGVLLISACANNPYMQRNFSAVGLGLDVSPTSDTYRGVAGAMSSDTFVAPQETSAGEILSAVDRTYDGNGNLLSERSDGRSGISITTATSAIDFGLGGDGNGNAKLDGLKAVGAAANQVALWMACVEGAAGPKACEILAANGQYEGEGR